MCVGFCKIKSVSGCAGWEGMECKVYIFALAVYTAGDQVGIQSVPIQIPELDRAVVLIGNKTACDSKNDLPEGQRIMCQVVAKKCIIQTEGLLISDICFCIVP